MSIVASRIRNGVIKIAADSQFTAGDNVSPECSHKKKLRSIKGIIVGVTGACEEMDMFYMYVSGNKPPVPTEQGMFDYITNFYKVRNGMNDCLRGADNRISNNTYTMIVDGKLFLLCDSFIVQLKNNTFRAFGSGWELAMGAMEMGADPVKAVEVVCKYNIYCSLPVINYEVPYAAKRR